MPAARLLPRRQVAAAAVISLATLALVAPADRALAGVPDCSSAYTDDGTSYQLNSDCLATSTIVVPNGATFDGNGFTITAGGAFSGPVIASTPGDALGATQLAVTDVHIVAALAKGPAQDSDLSGIAFYNAGGSVNNTTIDGLSRHSSGNEGFGILVRNSTIGGGIDLTISGVTITNFQRAGIRLDGTTNANLSNVTIGRSDAPRANPDGIEVSRGASGGVYRSTISLNHSTSATKGAHATGVSFSDAGEWYLDRVLFKGADGDVGIESHRSTASSSPMYVSCARFSRTSTPSGDGRYGIGILKSGLKNQDTQMFDTAFSGWKRDTAFATGDSSPSYTGSGMTMGHLAGACPMTAPADVRASGGDGSSKVTWKPATVTKYSALTGYTVRASRPGSSTKRLRRAQSHGSEAHRAPQRTDLQDHRHCAELGRDEVGPQHALPDPTLSQRQQGPGPPWWLPACSAAP